jgi:arylsulfatase A-like enzyme
VTTVRNILFIMCDQLRADYLSCYGHPFLQTPHIDGLARRGVLFSNAFVQSASCGPSRMSYYTGRYVSSHRAFGNFVPLPIDELTLGDYLRPHGIRVAVDGKTHVEPDVAGMAQRGIPPDSMHGVLVTEGGFEPYDRHDGVLADAESAEARTNRYSAYLRSQGYEGTNPWLDYANSGSGGAGEILSGWQMRYANRPARVREEHSETAYTTDRAIAFIQAQGDSPWCLHLSYIKPHWPYVAPHPYNALFSADHVLPAKRYESEVVAPHPIVQSYMRHPASVNFSSDEVRRSVIPVYMGLVKQIDDHLGRVFDALERMGRFADTMVVFCSDHGDYLGDHFLGEKELHHDTVTRTPLVVYDPSAGADRSRGTECPALVEAIDLLPTFLDALDIAAPEHVLEGRSLLPWIREEGTQDWRKFAVSEFDYAFRTQTRRELKRPLDGCKTFTIRDHDWKFVYCQGFRPLLFDLRRDPDEFFDLGTEPGHGRELERYSSLLFDWLLERKRSTTVTRQFVEEWLNEPRFNGMSIGHW